MRSLGLMFGIGILAGSATLAGCSGAGGIFGRLDGGAGTGGQGGTAGTDAGGSGGSGATGGAAGSDGGTCDASGTPKDNPCAIDNQYGVFIDATGGSDDTGDGTEQHPYQTFKKGIEQATAAGKRLFACAGTYAESVKLTAANNGIEMYGGFACDSWAYTGDKTEVKDATHGPALGIDAVDGAHVEDIAFTSSDAVTPGDSSVAASVNTSTKIELVRVVLTAGKGAAGLDAAAFTTSATTGTDGNPGSDACHANPNPGGPAASTTCGADTSIGGKGGLGGVGTSTAGNGDSGQPDLGKGRFGSGQGDSNWDCSVGKTIDNGGGHLGADGANGTPRPSATGLGTLTESGVTGVSGKSGTDGKPGQGGGGGGGAQAPGGTASLVCSKLTANVGASGGSGGGGGCGGTGGPGGGAGGSSIALVSIGSDVVLTDCQLVAAEGGAGGKGALGQIGGNGGSGAAGGNGGLANNGCRGGDGGKGGHGGPGGGGVGGHSIAIAYTGTVPLVGATTTTTEASTAAKGGLGGGASIANKGDDGVTKDLQSF